MKYKAAPAAGTVADLVMRYRKSPRVLGWAYSTRVKFDGMLGRFMAANRLVMVADIRRGDILAARDELAATPGEANNWLKVISGLLDYGADIEMIPFNPARGIKRLKLREGGFRSWREDEIAAFQAHWPAGSLPRLTFTLALCTGAARGDLVRLGPRNVSEDRIVFRRQKTGGGFAWSDRIQTKMAKPETGALKPRPRDEQHEAGSGNAPDEPDAPV